VPDAACIDCPFPAITVGTGASSVDACVGPPGFFINTQHKLLLEIEVPSDQYNPDTFELYLRSFFGPSNDESAVRITVLNVTQTAD
jgi:hypothetical protein